MSRFVKRKLEFQKNRKHQTLNIDEANCTTTKQLYNENQDHRMSYISCVHSTRGSRSHFALQLRNEMGFIKVACHESTQRGGLLNPLFKK